MENWSFFCSRKFLNAPRWTSGNIVRFRAISRRSFERYTNLSCSNVFPMCAGNLCNNEFRDRRNFTSVFQAIKFRVGKRALKLRLPQTQNTDSLVARVYISGFSISRKRSRVCEYDGTTERDFPPEWWKQNEQSGHLVFGREKKNVSRRDKIQRTWHIGVTSPPPAGFHLFPGTLNAMANSIYPVMNAWQVHLRVTQR